MRNTYRFAIALLLGSLGCGVTPRGVYDGGNNRPDLFGGGNFDLSGNNQQGCGELSGCYTVYAHSNHVLYLIDLPNKLLKEVGPFNAPQVNGQEDVITDLAVRSDGSIYAISHTMLYTADPNDGHVTEIGPVTDCGMDNVALTFTADDHLYAADYKGAFCSIDISGSMPQVHQIATLNNGMAVSGDLVAVSDGTMYATVYSLSNSSTQNDNSLAKIDPTSGQITQTVGQTGFAKIFGVAYSQAQVFGFTHDGSGDVVTIDPKTGRGTLYNSFTDSTGNKISFAGAGVNAMVAPGIM